MEGGWEERGRINTGDSRFCLDATNFKLRGKRYLVWAQKPASQPPVSNLYIAELENPWTIKGNIHLLSEPEYPMGAAVVSCERRACRSH